MIIRDGPPAVNEPCQHGILDQRRRSSRYHDIKVGPSPRNPKHTGKITGGARIQKGTLSPHLLRAAFLRFRPSAQVVGTEHQFPTPCQPHNTSTDRHGRSARSTGRDHPSYLPHRTTGHPYRGMSVSVRLDGARTLVGHVCRVGGRHTAPHVRAWRCVGA